MNENEIKRFLTLRSKLWAESESLEAEMAALETRIEELDKRHTHIQNILDGSVGGVEDLPENTEYFAGFDAEDPAQFDDAVANFLMGNPRSKKRDIVAALDEVGQDIPHKVEKSLKRLKRAERIVRSGATTNSTWSLA